jgi:hypothetical protein
MRGCFPHQGAPALNCPGCGARVAGGTAICPACDYIIDDSFLAGAAEAPDDESDTGAPPSRGASPASRPARAGARGTASRPSVKSGSGARPRVSPSGSRSPPPKVASEEATDVKSMEEVRREAPSQRAGAGGARPAARPAPGARPAPAAAPRRQEPEFDEAERYSPPRGTTGLDSNIVAPEEVMDDFRQFVGELSLSDKLAFAGAALVVLSAFIPWKETAADGEILGLMSQGLVAVLSAGGLMGTITLRVRRVMPRLNVLIPWLLQLVLAVFTILWCVIFMKLSSDTTEVPSPMGNAMIMNSTPALGVYVGLLGALGSLAGTLMGLKEKPA